MRAIATILLASVLLLACGGSDPEAEATWETHTTAEEETSGDEQP